MTLRPLADLTAADWLLDDTAAPGLRFALGPSGFASYARVLHSRTSEGERFEGHVEDRLLAALVDVLGRHTWTPDDCLFGLWDGYGDIHGGEAVHFLTKFVGPARWPGRIFTKEKPPPPPPAAFPASVMDGPRLTYGEEDHLLFGGPLRDTGRWGAASYGHGVPRNINSPNLMWPADHAWFVTTNIESSWTGVGGSAELVNELLDDPRLEVVRQRYDGAELR